MSETRLNDAAFPHGKFKSETGLTKRELIAAMEMLGLLSDGHHIQTAARLAVEAADLLIEELNKPKK